MRKMLEGGCLCGAIRFVVSGHPRNPHTCSCGMCQRHTGALTVCWLEFDRDQVSWTGPGGAPATYRSSEISRRAFCPACGSTLGAIDDKPTIALVAGVFDRPAASALRPLSHAYRVTRPAWWHVEVGKPRAVTARRKRLAQR